MKTTVVACVDGDGHFHVVQFENRKEVIKALKKIEDGDFWANEIEIARPDEYTEDQLLTISDGEWISVLNELTQRGRMEIVEIEINVKLA